MRASLEALDDRRRSFPISSDDGEEGKLWWEFKVEGAAEARARLFSLYADFACKIARRHYLDRKTGDIEFADLRQLASAGLLEALDHFDPERGAKFTSYARSRISGSVLDGVSHMSEMREQLSFRRRARRERVKSLLPGDASSSSAADALEALIEIATGLAVGFMLEGASGFAMEGEVDPAASAYETLAWKETVERLMVEVATLPEREQAIIRQHYILGLGFDQIGLALGVSKGRVSQLHRAAIGLLRSRLEKPDAFFVTK